MSAAQPAQPIAVIVGLWGFGMAGQLASETLLHQGTAKLERPTVAGS